jgi:hypothetical protein
MLGWCVAGVAAAGSLGAAPALAPRVIRRRERSEVLARSTPLFGRYRYERLDRPDRTVVYDERASVVATLTEGARSALFVGGHREFVEPAATRAHVDSAAWVRLAPRPWRFGAHAERWFTDWFTAECGRTDVDALGMAMQYVTGAPRLVNSAGTPYGGDAGFGPVLDGQRDQHSDFYDYLGVSWTWPDGSTSAPRPNRYRDVDCSGFLRLVWGYRMGLTLLRDQPVPGTAGLPREAHDIAASAPAVALFDSGVTHPSRGQLTLLQPGDLVFFALHENPRYLSHAGMVLGRDGQGHLRFVSSRSTINGPTLGDVAGIGRLDGRGYYPDALRRAVRL